MKKLVALAFVVFGLPLWWWSYWKIDSELPINTHDYLSNAIGDVRPTPDSFNGLLQQAEKSDNRRLFKLLKGFSPITVRRPGADIVAKVPGDLTPYAVMAGSTDDSWGTLSGKAAETHNAALQNLLRSLGTTAVFLKGYAPGRDASIFAAGDILTRFDWNAQGDQKVRGSDGRHLTLTFDGLQELKRRKQALIAAGVIEAPAPSQEEIESDAREEAAFPPHMQLERETPYSGSADEGQRAQYQKGAFPAGSTVAVYEVTRSGRACLIGDESSGLTGWIDAPFQGCGLSYGQPPQRPQTTVSLPPNWITDSDKRELESRGQQIQDAIAHPIDPTVASSLKLCEQYIPLFSAVFIGWCVLGLATGGIRNARLRNYKQMAPTRRGYGVADFGVPHCRFEPTAGGGFNVTLRNNYYSRVGCLFAFLTVPALGILYYFFGGASTSFLVILTVTVAVVFFSFYRAPSRIEVTSDTITINGTRLERDHFGNFHVHGRQQLGYQHGLRNYWLPGSWTNVEVTEIASALNAHLVFAPAPKPQPSPRDLRQNRPTDF
jgi:hypothetical protein